MRIVHWLSYEPAVSGLYNYTYSLHKATKALGYESQICYSDPDLQKGGKIRLPNPLIGEVEFSDWSVAKGAINFTHDAMPHEKLDNWVTEMHGHPKFVMQDMNPLTTTAYKLDRVKLVFTRFPSHLQYWREFNPNVPIEVIPPGVDLDFWTPIGEAHPIFQRPVVLWADTTRRPIKDPSDLLFAMKIVNKELPTWGLKLVGINPEEIAGFAYACGALGLHSIIDFPLHPMIQEMAEMYRAVRKIGGLMYSDTNEEGSNSSWEAEACGVHVVHHKDTPEEIAEAIIDASKLTVPPPRRDIKVTAKAMVDALERHFGNLQASS